MEFYTVSKQSRPVRLSEATRQFAYDSLNHKYGLDTAKTPAVSLDGIDGFAELSGYEKHNIAIRKIAEEAPIRIVDGELISGAATLGLAVRHFIPAVIDGSSISESISHLTADYETVLRRGVNGIEADVRASLEKYTDMRSREFLDSCLSAVESMRIWHGRYLDALRDRPDMAENYRTLCRVPFEPARDFREAVQAVWFEFAFLRLTGNWPGIGRIDVLLGDYLKADLASGKLTLDEAREILAHLFIKGCEWVTGGDYGSGDAQHYQNIVLSGIDENGQDVTNEVTYLVLDIIEETGISDFPVSVRLNKNTSQVLLSRCAEVLKYGGGILAFYNEDAVIKTMTDYGYPLSDARTFANDGCWEIQVPGATYFNYLNFDSLAVLQDETMKEYEAELPFASFDELYAQYVCDLKRKVRKICDWQRDDYLDSRIDYADWKSHCPCTVVSLFERGCIEKGRSYLEGGPRYNVFSVHIGGFPDTVNALYAIKKLVYDDGEVTLNELVKILHDDWDGHEALRRKVRDTFAYYGNGNPDCDEIGRRVLSDFADACMENDKYPLRFPAGVSTFGNQLAWSKWRIATAHGFKAHSVLAPNCSPTPGTDRQSATAVIRSYCHADLSRMVTGAALDLKLLPSSVEGEDGTNAIISLLRGFVSMGGCFIQPDVEDREILKKAKECPENYQTLSVRVSGWNARFVTLNNEWQDMLIDETK